MRRLVQVLGVVWGLAVGDAARACPTCGTGDPTAVGVDATRVGADGLRASSELDLGSDGRGAGAEALTRTDLRLGLAVAYAFGRAFTLAAELPVVHRDAAFAGQPDLERTGLGDGQLRLAWTAYRDRPFASTRWAVLTVGAGLPTAPLWRDASGAPLDWRLQLGTGALEPLAAAELFQRWGDIVVSAGVHGALPLPGWLGVQKGASVRVVLGGQASLSAKVALRLDLEARADAATRVSGAVDPDSGGFLASVVPALVAQPLPELALAVSIREPVAEAVRGAQEHGTLYRVVATWTP